MALRSHTSSFQKSSSNNEVPLEMEPLFETEDPKWSKMQTNEKLKKFKIEEPETVVKRWDPSQAGLAMAVGSSLLFSLCSLLVKVMDDIPSPELATFRFVGILLPTFPLAIASREPLFPKSQRLILILRGIFGTTSLLLQFYAFQHLPLGDASVIIFSAPVFVALFARIFLKEQCSLFQGVLIIITLVGVALITRPPWLFGPLSHTYTAFEWKGVIAAFAGTIVAANVYVMLRILRNLHFAIILFDFAVVALLITPTFTLLSSNACFPQCGSQRWMILGIGLFSFGGQILKTRALQLEEAGPVSIARTADVIFAFLWQLIFFGDVPDTLTVFGTILVTSCVLLLGIRRWILTLSKSSVTRKRLSFLV